MTLIHMRCVRSLTSNSILCTDQPDFISAFKQNVVDMNMLGEYGIAQEYNKLLSFYEMFSGK